uniref:Uncharacterized protein n=1 Tax=Lygus hesperus TaxID=30085 RepID=A0A0A9YGK6_LYGHE
MSSHPITISQLPHVGINISSLQNNRRFDRNFLNGRGPTNLLGDQNMMDTLVHTNDSSALPPGLMLMAPPPPQQLLLLSYNNNNDTQPHHLHPPTDIVRNLPSSLQYSHQPPPPMPSGDNHAWSSSYGNIPPMQPLQHSTTDPNIATFIPPPPPLNLLQSTNVSSIQQHHPPGQNSMMFMQNHPIYNPMNHHPPPPPSRPM